MEFLYSIAGIMIFLSVFLRICEKRDNYKVQKVVDNHNKEALFIYNEKKDLNEIWIKDKRFLKSTNSGKHPSEFNGELSMFDYKSAYCLVDIQER